jgi:tripeptide aminopeptidase
LDSNLIVNISPKNSIHAGPLLLGVHADTVKPGKNIEPVLENGVIRTRGNTILGADDKESIVVEWSRKRGYRPSDLPVTPSVC